MLNKAKTVEYVNCFLIQKGSENFGESFPATVKKTILKCNVSNNVAVVRYSVGATVPFTGEAVFFLVLNRNLNPN